ncbi:NUDIX domain-containing protein [Micromonospora sp. b486]|uniref:NUDIX domain-containing protein n=1 Tax=Micromonospora sp. b486 TaxID=3053986 RepID=UPI00259D2C87|nr:NUDIX domain-containing protein [Micromonospora sp. b486]MDM4777887.1 NUDIX domain-containing protein [Micromonospora sp. b486]
MLTRGPSTTPKALKGGPSLSLGRGGARRSAAVRAQCGAAGGARRRRPSAAVPHPTRTTPISACGGSCRGGGLDPGETYRGAAVRELREETGIAVGADEVGAPTWRRRASFRHRQRRHLQDEVVVTVRLPGPGPDVDEALRLDYEVEDYFGFRWCAGRGARRAAALLSRAAAGTAPAFLAGTEIDEPFELWS